MKFDGLFLYLIIYFLRKVYEKVTLFIRCCSYLHFIWYLLLLESYSLVQQDPIIEIGTQFDPYENVLNIVYGDIKDLKIKGKVDTNNSRRIFFNLSI